MKNKLFRAITAAVLLAMLLGAFVGCSSKVEDNNENGADIYAIKYNGHTVALGANAKTVVEKIGEPNSTQNTGNCGGQGETIRYDYMGFEMVVVEYKSGAKVDQIEIRNDLVETSKGITIGSSERAVKEAYGEPSRTTEKALCYENGNKELTIGIEDGFVISLNLRVVG